MKTKASVDGITEVELKHFENMMNNGRFAYAFMAYSDIHFHDHPRNKQYKSEAYDFVSAATNKFCKIAQDTPFSIMFLGDYFDNPAPKPDDIRVGYNLICDIMKRCCKEKNFNGYFEISGNHVKRDYGENDIGTVLHNIYNYGGEAQNEINTAEHNIFILNNLHSYSVNYKDLDFVAKARDSYIYVQDDRTEIKIELKNVGSIILKFLCYNERNIREPYTFETEYKEDAVANIALFHLPIQNAWYDTGVMATSGANLPKDYFDDFNITLGGDYHTPQTVTYFNSPVMYIGAPAQFHFGHKFDPVIRYVGMTIEEDTVQFYSCSIRARNLRCVNRRFVSVDAGNLSEVISLLKSQATIAENEENSDDNNSTRIVNLYTIRITGNSNEMNLGEFEELNQLTTRINNYFLSDKFKENLVSENRYHSYLSGHVIINDTKVIISKNSSTTSNDSRSISEVLESHRNIRGDLLISDFSRFVEGRFIEPDITTIEGKKESRIFSYVKQHILEAGKT